MTANYIFDLDGTLVDSHAGIAVAATSAVVQTLPGRAVPDFRPFIGPPIREIFLKALGDLESDVLNDLIITYREHYDNAGCLQARLYDGVRSTLDVLQSRGSRLFIVTNKPALPTSRMLDKLQLKNYFTGVVSPDSRSPSLPNKTEAVLYLIDRFKINVPESVIVGDSVDDAKAAFEGNIPFLAAAYGYGSAHQQKDWPVQRVVVSFSEILP
jgi:phosphoglycolate phosphatase